MDVENAAGARADRLVCGNSGKLCDGTAKMEKRNGVEYALIRCY